MIAYFDCYSGVSGDMIIASLLDAGVSISELEAELKKLGLSGYSISSKKVKRASMTGTSFEVSIEISRSSPPSRSAEEIIDIIDASGLEEDIKVESCAVFKTIRDAEARIHGMAAQDVHLHEVGSLDSIVDIVGSVIALKRLGIDEVRSSVLRVGRGFVEAQHGRLPVPSPATMEILKGIPVDFTDIETEITTPTGSAIIATLCKGYGPLNGLKIEKIGYGAGSKRIESIPNMLRVIIGTG